MAAPVSQRLTGGDSVPEREAVAKALRPETWSRRDALEAFSGLRVPEPAELCGKWDGEFVGRPALVRVAQLIAMPTPLRGWCGKEITDTQNLHNLVRRRGSVKPSVRVKMSPGMSRFDGKPVVALSYAETARPPVSYGRAELRWLSPGDEVLGLLILTMGRRYIGPFPFRLTRSQS